MIKEKPTAQVWFVQLIRRKKKGDRIKWQKNLELEGMINMERDTKKNTWENYGLLRIFPKWKNHFN